jgi:hypothetical protein
MRRTRWYLEKIRTWDNEPGRFGGDENVADRLPGWAWGEPVAGDLYRYLDHDTPQPIRLRVDA